VTIRKGEAWGEPGQLPADGVVVRSDAEARSIVTAARRTGRPVPVLGLLDGDLARSLGARGDAERLRGPEARRVAVDLGAVLLDGTLHWFVAHLIARRPLWHGRVVAAMNAERLGPWKVAPRAHPNDGLLDVLDGRLGLDDRLKARRRAVHGDHLPHPSITVTRTAAVQIDLDRPTLVRLDGEPVGRARRLSIRVEPDALTCIV
jgi:hypothetical protein